jgi:hypothetical protein
MVEATAASRSLSPTPCALASTAKWHACYRLEKHPGAEEACARSVSEIHLSFPFLPLGLNLFLLLALRLFEHLSSALRFISESTSALTYLRFSIAYTYTIQWVFFRPSQAPRTRWRAMPDHTLFHLYYLCREVLFSHSSETYKSDRSPSKTQTEA